MLAHIHVVRRHPNLRSSRRAWRAWRFASRSDVVAPHTPSFVAMATSALDDVVLIASAAKDSHIVAFDARTGAVVKQYVAKDGAAALCVSNCERIIAIAPDKRAMTTHGVDKESLERASVLPERPSAVCASRDGAYVASGSASGTCAVWEARSGRLLARFKAHFKGVTTMTFTPCGSALVTGGEDGAVHAWRVSALCDDGGAGTRANAWRSWTEHALGVSGVTCGSVAGAGGDVSVVSCSADRTCKIYSLGNGTTLRQVRCPTALTCCALDACEATLYAGGVDGRVFEIPLNGAPSVAASLDGGIDARDGMVALVGHSKKLVSVRCSSDGNSIISASEDGTARVWDVASRQTLHILRHPKAPISDIALIPRSRYSGQGRGDYGADRKRAKTLPAPTFSKFLIGPGDRSGLKSWQGTSVSIFGISKKRAVDASQTVVCDDAPTTSGAVDDDARAALAKKSTELDRARAEVEEWKKLYGDLKSLVDRQLVDAP